MATSSLDPWTVLVVDKLITGFILLAAGWFLNRKLEAFKSSQAHALETFRQQKILESEGRRAVDERNREWSREIRAALADLATSIALCNQELAWLSWQARDYPDTITQARLDSYDSAMKIGLTDMFRARVRLAALSEKAHAKLRPCIDEVYKLDLAIAAAGVLLKQDSERSVAQLAKLHPQVESLYDLLLSSVSDEMRDLVMVL